MTIPLGLDRVFWSRNVKMTPLMDPFMDHSLTPQWTRLWTTFRLRHFCQKDPCLRLDFSKSVKKTRKWHHNHDTTMRFSKKSINLVIFLETTVKPGWEVARTHTTVRHQGSHHVHHHPLPGYHHPVPTHWARVLACTHRVWQADHGSPGFFWIQWSTHNTDLVKNHTFFIGQNRPVKTDVFVKKAYLILISFHKKAIFGIFSKNHWF